MSRRRRGYMSSGSFAEPSVGDLSTVVVVEGVVHVVPHLEVGGGRRRADDEPWPADGASGEGGLHGGVGELVCLHEPPAAVINIDSWLQHWLMDGESRTGVACRGGEIQTGCF